MYSDGHAWPGRKDTKFWNDAADFIKKEANTLYTQSGKYSAWYLTIVSSLDAMIHIFIIKRGVLEIVAIYRICLPIQSYSQPC